MSKPELSVPADAARPIGIDLFAGVGGMSLGFEQAGFEVAAAVEIDPVHAAAHCFNFPRCAVLPSSVVGLSGARIRSIASLGSRRVDVVFGGPPCQGFSLMGQRSLDDPRNGLVKEFVRLVVELDAAYFVLENVRGLTVGRQVRFLQEVIGAFQGAGYRVRLPWQVLNACRYSVPQDRQRLFLMGAKTGLPLPEYPLPTSRPPESTRDLFALEPGPTCEDALGDLPEAEDFPELFERDWVRTTLWGEPSRYAREMRALDPGAWHLGYRRDWDPTVLTASLRARHTPLSRERFHKTRPGEVEPVSRFYKLAAEGICNTLRAGTDSARGAFTSPRPIHFARPRCVTVREMARLHGYPDWFRFHSTKWHGARQVGNSVPPPLARAVAGRVMIALGRQPVAPAESLVLGDPTLLEMDMSQAAAYWGVANPIAQRNRSREAGREMSGRSHPAEELLLK